MSTKIGPNRKFVSRVEKSQFLIFRPEVPYAGFGNVVGFFSWNVFWTPQKIYKKIKLRATRAVENIKGNVMHTLQVKFALFRYPIRLMLINFKGQGEPLNIPEISPI